MVDKNKNFGTGQKNQKSDQTRNKNDQRGGQQQGGIGSGGSTNKDYSDWSKTTR